MLYGYTLTLKKKTHFTLPKTNIDIAPEDGPQKKNSSSNPSICSDFPPPVYKRFTERRPGNLEASRRGKPPTSTWFCCRKVTISLEPKLRSVNFHHSTKSWRLLVVFCGSKKKTQQVFFCLKTFFWRLFIFLEPKNTKKNVWKFCVILQQNPGLPRFLQLLNLLFSICNLEKLLGSVLE